MVVGQKLKVGELTAERKEFVSKQTGEKFTFTEYSCIVNGMIVKFTPRAEDKKLIEYFLSKINNKE